MQPYQPGGFCDQTSYFYVHGDGSGVSLRAKQCVWRGELRSAAAVTFPMGKLVCLPHCTFGKNYSAPNIWTFCYGEANTALCLLRVTVTFYYLV